MLLQHDGFDTYGTQALTSATLESSKQWVSKGYVLPTAGLSASTSYGKNAGSLGLILSGSTADLVWIKRPIRHESNNTGAAFTPTGKLVLGFAVRFILAPTGSLNFARLAGFNLNIGSDWFIYADGVNTNYQCELNIWNFVELEYEVSTKTMKVYMTDTLVATKVLAGTPVLDFWEIRSHFTSGGNTSAYMHVDDQYLLDSNPVSPNGSSTTNIERIGKCNTITQYPTADSAVAMAPFPVSPANNYSKVNQAAHDADTTYVSTNIAGATDLYVNPTAFPTVDDAAIRAVTICPVARMLEPDALSVTAVIKSGATEKEGHRMKLKAGSYTAENHIFEVNPATGLQWTPTEAQNVKFGQRLLPKL